MSLVMDAHTVAHTVHTCCLPFAVCLAAAGVCLKHGTRFRAVALFANGLVRLELCTMRRSFELPVTGVIQYVLVFSVLSLPQHT